MQKVDNSGSLRTVEVFILSKGWKYHHFGMSNLIFNSLLMKLTHDIKRRRLKRRRLKNK